MSKKRKKKKTPKLRPKKNQDSNLKHGVWALDTLLKADLDGRLAIVKKKNLLESQWVDYCGGPDRLVPPVIGLIKRIVHKELIAAHAEKMALIGEYDLTDKRYLALTNSQRLDKEALQRLLNDGRGRSTVPSIRQIIAESKTK